MVYITPIDKIGWDDIGRFCEEKVQEGAYLDYKEDFPQNLEKTIAAMANTLGGIILIGIAEDDQNKPVLPLKGILFKRGYPEQITNIILSNITPPLFPEIAVCKDESGQNTIIVVRIYQSDQTPHAIAASTKVYLRTGVRNNPETLASIKEIEWLQNKRQKSLDLRNSLYERAEERSERFYLRQLQELKQRGDKIEKVEKAWLTLSLCPLYPKKYFRSPPEINDEVYNKIQVDEYMRTGKNFPLPDLQDAKIVQDGIVLSYIFRTNKIFHTELNSFGLYFYKQSLLRDYELFGGERIKAIQASEMFCRLDEFFDSAVKFYNELGYWGLLHLRIRLDNISSCNLLPYPLEKDTAEPFQCIDPKVAFSASVLVGGLNDQKEELIFDSARKIAWTFGWNISKELLSNYYEKYKKK